MKRRLAAAILTATVTAGAMTLPAAAGEWDNEQQAACTETVQSPQQSGWQCAGGNWYYKNADGSYRQGWMRERGQWYFFDGQGVMVTGWAEIVPVHPTGWFRKYTGAIVSREPSL